MKNANPETVTYSQIVENFLKMSRVFLGVKQIAQKNIEIVKECRFLDRRSVVRKNSGLRKTDLIGY